MDLSTFNKPSSPQCERLSFTGRGGEYFRIWVVNLLLTIITLGIYSAWAKVRRTRYFYNNTNIAGNSFEYHGNPIAILKGRIIAVVLIVCYNIATELPLFLSLLAMFFMMTVMPWLIWKSYQFRLYNSSYRGIRFSFRGSLGQSYQKYLLLPLFAVLSLGLLIPFIHQRITQYLHSESKFGSTHFSFNATVNAFYRAYLISSGITLLGYIVLGTLFGGAIIAGFSTLHESGFGDSVAILSLGAMIFILYFWGFIIFPLLLTMLQNVIWNHTHIGTHSFQSNLQWQKTLFIVITNLLGILITLGLFIPFAKIRWMKYRIESISLAINGSLDNFIADSELPGSAVGEGVSDLLDFDLSL